MTDTTRARLAEPDYVRQIDDLEELTALQVKAWFKSEWREAAEAGCTWGRFSVDDPSDPAKALVEAWITRPDDEGPIRWQMQRDSTDTEQ